MARPTSKVRLENGLKLDLPALARRGIVKPGANIGPVCITWTSDYWGEIASARIWATMTDHVHPSMTIQMGEAYQDISLTSQPRFYGGRQYYFVCPTTGGRASVLWRPPGATRFYSRQAFGRQVAYTSQCLDRTDRTWRAISKIKSRLIGDLDPDEWDLPPKPKWMRWHSYRRYEDRFDRLDAWLDHGVCLAAARLVRVW